MNATAVDPSPAGDTLAGMQRAAAKAPAAERVFARRGRPPGKGKAKRGKPAAKPAAKAKRPYKRRKPLSDLDAYNEAERLAAKTTALGLAALAAGAAQRTEPWRYMVGNDGTLLLRHADMGDFELPPADAFNLATFLRTCSFAFMRLEEQEAAAIATTTKGRK
jgi:hypothetical protein